jgi:hypothetical protein
LADLEELDAIMTDRRRGTEADTIPPGVEQRLARLRALYVPERDEDARRRLAQERPSSAESFATAVARRLEKLHALRELANHLHRGRR